MDDYNDLDNELSEKQHAKLVENVLALTKRPHLKKPTRTEPTLRISEFNLVKSITGKQGVVHVNDLTKALKKRAKHVEISKKLRSTERKAKVLPKPLEKPQAQRLKRNIAYQNVKKNLDRWDAIVTKNRGAHHLPFPVPSKLKLYTTGETIKEFNSRNNAETVEYPLTMQEILERRKEIAKMRAVQSYQEAKARRQSKIKSKKYHRIQRKEKIKNQIKEFELLQKTNPEEALKKLEDIERARAQERASLRHHSTGKWAQNLQVRAKYDKDSRQVLAQQLSISRDLRQKLQNDKDSESEGDEPVSTDVSIQVITNNPWTNSVVEKNEVTEFMDNYRKFWEKVNGPAGNDIKTNTAKPIEENVSNLNEIVFKEVNEVTSLNNSSTNNKEMKLLSKKKQKVAAKRLNTETIKQDVTDGIIESVGFDKKPIQQLVSKGTLNQTKFDVKIKEKLPKNKKVLEMVNKDRVKNPTNAQKCNSTTKWEVIDCDDDTDANTTFLESNNIENVFDNYQRNLKTQIDNRYETLKTSFNNSKPLPSAASSKRKPKNNKKIKSNVPTPLKDNQSLIDENFSENTVNDNQELQVLKSILNSSEKIADSTTSGTIKTKAINLNTDVPDLFSLEDNEENIDQKGIITEAFEDDDIVEEFHKEKQAEIDSGKPEDIDLNLPGWGSWGGVGIKASKRKNRRLIVKFPKEFKRRDDNKKDVFINEKSNQKIKKHMVSEVPFPFRNVKDYEASVRAPIGETFVPELAFKKMIKPSVTTKMGAIIEPMSEEILID